MCAQCACVPYVCPCVNMREYVRVCLCVRACWAHTALRSGPLEGHEAGLSQSREMGPGAPLTHRLLLFSAALVWQLRAAYKLVSHVLPSPGLLHLLPEPLSSLRGSPHPGPLQDSVFATAPPSLWISLLRHLEVGAPEGPAPIA